MKKLLTVIIVLLLFVQTAPFAQAAELSLSRKGSLTIKLEYNGESLAGVSLSIHLVADAKIENGAIAYELAGNYANSRIDLSSLDLSTKANNASLTELLYSYAPADNAASSQLTNTRGQLSFSNLSPGLYLVAQSESSSYAVAPFLVPVPIPDGTGWNYTVEAYPKTEPSSAPPTTDAETPLTSAPPETTAPPIPSTPVTPTPIPTTPTPDSSSDDDYSYYEPPVESSVPSDSTESASEIPTDTPVIAENIAIPNPPQRDLPTTQNLSNTLVRNDDGSYLEIDPDGVPLGTWTYDEEQGIWVFDEIVPLAYMSLPQTGVLYWPIPLLASGGVLMFATGWIITRKENETDEK